MPDKWWREEQVGRWAKQAIQMPKFDIQGIDPLEIGELLADAYLPIAPWSRETDTGHREYARRRLREIGDKLKLPPPPF